MNRIILSGNLTKTPELKVYQSTTVAKFGIAVKRPFSKNDETDFFNVVAFGKTAELCAKYLEKGDKIKLSIRFKGRQMAHTELGKEVLEKFAARLENISAIEQAAKLDGRSMTMLLAPIKDNK